MYNKLKDVTAKEILGRGIVQSAITNYYSGLTWEFEGTVDEYDSIDLNMTGTTPNGKSFIYSGEIKVRYITKSNYDSAILEVLKYNRIKDNKVDGRHYRYINYWVSDNTLDFYDLDDCEKFEQTHKPHIIHCRENNETQNKVDKPVYFLRFSEATSIKVN